jgi:hypothetical protein
MQDRRVEDPVERLLGKNVARDVADQELEVRAAVARLRELHHPRIEIDADDGERRVERGERLAAGPRAHAHVGNLAHAEQVGGRERHLLSHRGVHAPQVALIGLAPSSHLPPIELCHRPARSISAWRSLT